jgi:hypothetical protein
LNEIQKTDNNYVSIIPGEEVNLESEEIKNTNHKKISYALIAEGYLYEWIIDKSYIFNSEPASYQHKYTKTENCKNVVKKF